MTRRVLVACALVFATSAQAQYISTIAGGGPDGVPALAANIRTPYALARDSAGNLYIADASAHRVYKVDTLGELTIFAGTGGPSLAGDGGPARDAGLDFPRGLAVDAADNVYISDTNNDRVRMVDAVTGIITTVAGSSQGFFGDGGPATLARMTLPAGITIDSAGDLFIADTSNERIRRVSGGIINTVAGNGITGSGGDAGLATSANLNGPIDVAVDSAGNLFIADQFNNKVRRVDGVTGIITTFAGTGAGGYNGDGILATLADLRNPRGVDVDATDDLYLADMSNHRIRYVNVPSGLISTVAGTFGNGFSGDGGPATAALLNSPAAVLVETSGDVLIADSSNRRVRSIDSVTGFIDTIAGNGNTGFGGDGAPAVGASLALSTGVALDAAGNVYIGDFNNFRIRRIDAVTGIITTFAGNGLSGDLGDGGLATDARIRLNSSTNHLAVDSAGNLYFSQRDSHRVRRVDGVTGIITGYAGNGLQGFSGDGGSALGARLSSPGGLYFDAADNLYIADTLNDRIRRVDFVTKTISTVAGIGTAGFSGDGGPALAAELNTPRDVAFDGAGNMYIADNLNARVRMVDTLGIIDTVAGNGGFGFSGDGGPATSAQTRAEAITVDASGNLFIAAGFGNRIRFVEAFNGIISTFAGTGVAGFSGDGGPAASAQLNIPRGLTRDSLGNLLIADSNNNRIRFVELSADLAITKDDGQTSAVIGAPIQYTITVTNNGPGVVSTIRVVDVVPADILAPTFTPSTGTYNDITGEWKGLNMLPTDSVVLVLDGQISLAALGTLTNTVTVTPMGGVTDPNLANDTDDDVDTLVSPAALSVTKNVSPDPAQPGDTLTYDVTVTSSGPAQATNVVMTDTLPPDVTFQSSTPGAPTCTHALGVVTCNLGIMTAPSNQLVTILVTADAPGIQVNTATVSANEPELDFSDNTAVTSSAVDLPTDAVQVFTVTSTDSTNTLEWRNPASGSFLSTEIRFFETSGFPTSVADGMPLFNGGAAGDKGTLVHPSLMNGTTYYYAAFVHLSGPAVSAGAFTKGRPMDTTGPIKWAYNTNATAMAPTGIGAGAAYEVSNDQALHAMQRGVSGGLWAPGYDPLVLGAPSQSRPPVVPTPAIVSATRVVFVSAQDGHVYAVNADTGLQLWRTVTPLGEMLQGSPVGMFTAFPSGEHDFLFIGTRNSISDNAFYTLNVSDGTTVGVPFDNGGGANAIGIVSSAGSIDYVNDRAYFASRVKAGGTLDTLWAFDITAGGLSYAWSRALGDIDASPVLFNGRLYVGTNASKVYAIDAASGNDAWPTPFDCGDGRVKGFIFPDFSSTALYLSTTNRVWSLSDDGPSASETWRVNSIPAPSTPLLKPGEPFLYVGSSDGSLYELDLSGGPPPSITPILLGDGTAAIGSPSLDVTNQMIYVGSEGGAVYAVVP